MKLGAKLILISLFLLPSIKALAQPQCAIDLYRAPNSSTDHGAVIGGWAKADSPIAPVLVTLKNDGITYTGVADRQGRWAIYFKLLSSHATAEVWLPSTGESAACSNKTEIED